MILLSISPGSSTEFCVPPSQVRSKVPGRSVILVELQDLCAKPVCKLIRLADGISRWIDRLADDQFYRPGTKVMGVNGQQLIGANQRHRHQGYPRARIEI